MMVGCHSVICKVYLIEFACNLTLFSLFVQTLNPILSLIHVHVFMCVYQGFIWGQILGGTYTSVYTYVYTHTCSMALRSAYLSMILKTILMHAACISGFLTE